MRSLLFACTLFALASPALLVRAQPEDPPADSQSAPAADGPAADGPAADAPAADGPAAEDPGVGPASEEAAPEALPFADEDIVVTAQKREDRMMDVPISVSVVSADALKSSGAKNLTELQGVTPGVYFSGNASYGGAPMAIRGTAGTNTALLDDPVAVYIDGIYLPSGSFASSTLLDIASIEVARGPQGTLQGRNATAGAVIVRTADPKFALGGYARGSLATPMEYRLDGALTGPLLDTLAVRASVAYGREDGWADNLFDGGTLGSSESMLGRLVLLWKPDLPIRVRLASSYSRVEAEPALARWAYTEFNDTPGEPLVPVPTPTTPLDAATRAQIEDGTFNLNRPADAVAITFFNSLEATYSFGFADLISLTGLVLGDTDGNNDSDGLGRTDKEGFNQGQFGTETFSEELRLQSNTEGRFSWILGAYYSFNHQDMFFKIYNLNLTLGQGPTVAPGEDRRYTAYDTDQDHMTLAGFADATFDILDSLALTAGIRYTYEEKSFTLDRYARTFPGEAPITTLPVLVPPATPTDWDDVSYRGKLSFTPLDELLLYASFSEGFKSGGYNAFGADPAFNPEYLWSAELGAKVDLPDRRGWIAASGYFNRYNDLQIRAGVGAGGVAITNAADSKIQGFDVEGHVAVAGGLSLQGNVAYTHARFEEFTTARDLVTDMMVDATGNRLPRAPDWQFFAQATYDLQLGDAWAARGQVSYRWRDTIYYYHTNQDSPTLQGEPLGELGARLSVYYDPIDLSFSIFGTNLTNDRSVNGFSPNFSYPEVSFNKPTVLGIEVEKQF
jgi:iron complex outermembrane recepter protein